MTKAGNISSALPGETPPEFWPMSDINASPAQKAVSLKKSKHSRDPISNALKLLHDAVAKEPIPDSFLDLISQIEAKIESNRA